MTKARVIKMYDRDDVARWQPKKPFLGWLRCLFKGHVYIYRSYDCTRCGHGWNGWPKEPKFTQHQRRGKYLVAVKDE